MRARVLLNTEATPELLKAEKYDAIIAAIGAEPIMPKLPGSDKPNVTGRLMLKTALLSAVKTWL